MANCIGVPAISAQTVLTEGSVVVTPEGTGTVMAVHDEGAVALVRAATSTRPWAYRDLTRTDGLPVCAIGAEARAAQRQAQLAAAQTAAGAELRGDFRLTNLDLEAGHGRVQDAAGAEIAYVRVRFGEDGRRLWWLQRADGGPPFDTPCPEDARPDQPHAALRAAGWVYWYLRLGDTEHVPVEAVRARRTVTLTLARVRELRELPLPVSPLTGGVVNAPEWNARWRRYELGVDQMGALALAARTALSGAHGDTAEERRRRRVLTAAAEQLEFLAYDTARAHATIPAPGTPDPYDEPYTPPALEPTIIDLDILDDPEPITLFDLPTTSTPDRSASPTATSDGANGLRGRRRTTSSL